MAKLKNIDSYQIQQYQQNRYPLLFVEMTMDAEPGSYVEDYKKISYNGWFFSAHFGAVR